MDYYNQIKEATAFLQSKGLKDIDCGMVLGTGLGNVLNHIQVDEIIEYDKIPGFVHATVETHTGRLIYGTVENKKVLAMQGRFHYYEGYTMQQITFPIRVMKMLGVKNLLLSNAAGGINTGFKKGDLVLIRDHINLQTENPLRGLNSDVFGARFPDMSAPYNSAIMHTIIEQAAKLGLLLHSGVYASVNGPNLETLAEYKMLKNIGADLVGMSTVPEVIVANQVGLPCAAISVITDECDLEHLKPVDISEIIAAANEADTKLSSLFVEVIKHLHKL